MRLIGLLLILGLAFLAGFYVAWPLSLLVAVLGAVVLVLTVGLYRALPMLLILLISTAFLLGAGLGLPVAFTADRAIEQTVYDGIVSGRSPSGIIVEVGKLVDSRHVPADAVQRIRDTLEEIESEVEDVRVRFVTEQLTSIQETVEASGMSRATMAQIEQQGRELAVNREQELLDQRGATLAGELTRDIAAGRLQTFIGRGLLAASIVAAASLLVGMACAEVLVVHRGGDRLAAYKMMAALVAAPLFPTGNPLSGLFASLTRAFRALQVVQDGEVVYSKPSSDDFRMLGPGMVVIRAGSAAVFERSGKITRIVGPGFYLTEPFEHLSSVVDLSLQSETWTLEDVLTKDSVPLEVEFTVQYRIMLDQPALIAKAEYRLDDDAIRRAVLTSADWNRQTKVVAESILRDTIATRFLDEIYDPRSLRFSSGATPRVPLQHELRRRLSRESQRWGVEAVRVTLDRLTLPREVEQRMIEAWDVTWHDVVEVARALTEAKKLTTRTIGQGQADYLEAVNAAKARLEEAGVDRFIKFQDEEAAAWAERRAADISQRTKWLEATGDAKAKLEVAKISREIAEAEAQRRVTEARGKADAELVEGRARAMAEAERFREVLFSLQDDFELDKDTLCSVIIQLASVLTTVNDFQAFVRSFSSLASGRPALPDIASASGDEDRTVSGDGE